MDIISCVKKVRDGYIIHSSEGFRMSSKTEASLGSDVKDIYEKLLQVLTIQKISPSKVIMYSDNEDDIKITVKVNNDVWDGIISKTKEVVVESVDTIMKLDVVSSDEKYLVAIYDGSGV